MSTVGDAHQDVLIAEFPSTATSRRGDPLIRVGIRYHVGRRYLDVRRFVRDAKTGGHVPTRAGITLGITDIEPLRDALLALKMAAEDEPRSVVNVELRLSEEELMELAELVAPLVRPLEPSREWLTVAEAADYLRCKPQRIYDLRSAGRLPRTGDGARVLVRRTDLDLLVGAL